MATDSTLAAQRLGVAGSTAAPARRLIAGIAALASRNIRLTVVVSVVLICGSFAAAAVVQLRLDHIHAVNQASYYEARRAHDLASTFSVAFDRISRLGAELARGHVDESIFRALPAVAAISVFDAEGNLLKAAGENATAIAPRAKSVDSEGEFLKLGFPVDGGFVAVMIDQRYLVPPPLLNRASIVNNQDKILIAGPDSTAPKVFATAIDGWDAKATVPLHEEEALSAWYGSLPLYLFVILGPALVGGGLAALFVGEFERRQKATDAVRALRNARPQEAQLLVRLAQAERMGIEAQRSKSEFIAHMSHELRTPLNAIIGFSEVIERGFYGEVGHAKYTEYARDIGDAGRSLHSKIGDILEFANVEAGRYPLSPEKVDLAEIAERCVNDHMGRAFSRRIALELGMAEPMEVRTDPLAVSRILANLISNALTYTPEGGRVRLSVYEEDNMAVISIADTGRGFSPSEQELLGNPFARFDRSGAVTGTGLGLSIAMALARRMGGTVGLKNGDENGTTAELKLPKG